MDIFILFLCFIPIYVYGNEALTLGTVFPSKHCGKFNAVDIVVFSDQCIDSNKIAGT